MFLFLYKSLDLRNVPSYRDAYEHFITRDASKFWTSGQWMTEKGGGSDVGMNLTLIN